MLLQKLLINSTKPRTLNLTTRGFSSFNYLLNKDNDKIYNVATPIFYVNAVPHIGHLYTSVISDTIHRFQRDVLLKPSFLSTGTDEHGLKVQQAAQKQGIDPKLFCDGVSPSFKKLDKLFNVDYSTFIRTSDDNHKKTAQLIWKQLKELGYIYQDTYKGWYSIVDEAFYNDSEVEKIIDQITGVEKMVSKSTKSAVEWTEELNYKFILSQFKEKLLDYHTTNTKSILPLNRKQEVIEWLEGNLDDLSISRSITRLQWGIPVPDDDTQVMYVWFEALINYLTVTGYPNTPNKYLPTDLHVIGKDIVRFHAVYYPAILMALNLPLPTTLLTHGHWTMNNQKMSKSIGNVVDPINLVETVFKFDADPIRYYLLRDGGNFQMDGDWSNDTLKVKVNKELNGQLGNLMSRISGKKLNPKLVIPAYSAVENFKLESFDSLVQALNTFPDQFKLHFENFELGKSIQLSVDLLTLINKLIQDDAPWSYATDPTSQQRLQFVTFYTYETLRILSTLLQPVMPTKMKLVLDVLNVPEENRNWNGIGVGKGWNKESEVKLNWGLLSEGRLFELVK